MLFYTGTNRLTHRILYRIQRVTIFEKVAKNIETRAEQLSNWSTDLKA
jgi:hypothetical protein